MSKPLAPAEIWLAVGSQHLYGPDALRQVADNAALVAAGLDSADSIPVHVVLKPVLTDPEAIHALCLAADADPHCAGLVLWMHTFSPAKMWIRGLSNLKKPFLHLHTQFYRDLPWESIDMDFMNLHQAAHGDREAGFLHTRLRLGRRVVVGHWQDPRVQAEMGEWARVAAAWADLQGARFARFGDNMRQVAVTEGDKVAAEARFGFSVNGYGLGDLASLLKEVSDAEVSALCTQYEDEYEVAPELLPGGSRRDMLEDAARQELGIRAFLERGGFKGFTTTFEDLHGLRQLPGLACQRLMADGYGFGAEGDWKTAALLRFAKTAARGLAGGSSFMEDYTYHLDPNRPQVLGAHMLEICPSLASRRPRLEIHPLGIGGKDDPARLVFDAPAGPALNATLVDLGNRFRLVVHEVEAVDPPALPNLPVARALWESKPDFATGVAAWILAGGAHHTVYTLALGTEVFRDFARIAGIECVVIDGSTRLPAWEDQLRWNELAWHLGQGVTGR